MKITIKTLSFIGFLSFYAVACGTAAYIELTQKVVGLTTITMLMCFAFFALFMVLPKMCIPSFASWLEKTVTLPFKA
jgi:hypothetical protein